MPSLLLSRWGIALAASLAFTSTSCRQADPSKLVIGIQSDPMGGVVSALHIRVREGDAVVVDEQVKPPRGSRVGFPQPWERTLSESPTGAAQLGTKVEVEVEAIGDPAAEKPLLQRLASTHFIPGRTALLRVPLETRCIVYPPMPRGASKVPGPLSGPACTPPGTCIMGVCQSSSVPPARLEPYAPNWPTSAPDVCKTGGGGKPDVQIGTGQSYYVPFAKGQVLKAEAGPQGGHHIWIATRMKNLKQAGTTTRISGRQSDTGLTIPPTTLAFTYAPDEGGYCKLYGIRYQLDNEGIDYKPFLGKPLDVTVTVSDPTGTTATATTRVEIAATMITP